MTKYKNTIATVLFICAMGLGVSGCATTNNHSEPTAVYDPIEPVNRATLAFNELLDKILFNPVTIVYRTAVPAAGRNMVTNFLSNLRTPVYLANEILQGDIQGAGLVLKRFAINTFTGFGGLLDTASWEGITYQPADFGQTLALWGFGSGPYIVLPILGPSTLRDAVGFAGDIAFDPLVWYAYNTDREWINYTRSGLTIIDAKDRTYNMLTDLRRNSGDYYTALQSVYVQRREAQIHNAKTGSILPSALPQMD